MVSGVSSGASRADLAQQMQAMREAMFQKADTDGSGSSTGVAMSSDTLATLLSAQEDDGTGTTAAGTTGNTPGNTAADFFGSLDTDGDDSLSETGLEAGLASAPPPPPPGAEGGLGPMLSAQEDASSSDASQQNIRDLARHFIAAIQNLSLIHI